MRLVLLGGSGFLGQSLLRYLEETGERGRHKIVIYDPKPPEFFPPDLFVRGSLEETDRVRDLLEPDDVVAHMVHTAIASEFTDARPGLEESLSPSLRLVALLQERPVAGLVYFSSGGTIYGEPALRRPIPESAPVNPGSVYAAVKVKIEQAIMAGQKAGSLKYIILRPGNPFGPLQAQLNRHGVAAHILNSLALDREFTLYGDGETVRDYFYVDDLSRAFWLLLGNSRWGRVYNVGSGEGTSVNRLIELCREITGRKLRKIIKPARPTDLGYNVLDPAKLMSEGWSLQTPLRQGLSKTWNSF